MQWRWISGSVKKKLRNEQQKKIKRNWKLLFSSFNIKCKLTLTHDATICCLSYSFCSIFFFSKLLFAFALSALSLSLSRFWFIFHFAFSPQLRQRQRVNLMFDACQCYFVLFISFSFTYEHHCMCRRCHHSQRCRRQNAKEQKKLFAP